MNPLFLLALGGVAVLALRKKKGQPDVGGDTANPASLYCEEQGGQVDGRTDPDGNEYGMCVFPDGAEVEEWAFLRGEAEPAIPNVDEWGIDRDLSLLIASYYNDPEETEWRIYENMEGGGFWVAWQGANSVGSHGYFDTAQEAEIWGNQEGPKRW